jgi:hypothetical protein
MPSLQHQPTNKNGPQADSAKPSTFWHRLLVGYLVLGVAVPVVIGFAMLLYSIATSKEPLSVEQIFSVIILTPLVGIMGTFRLMSRLRKRGLALTYSGATFAGTVTPGLPLQVGDRASQVIEDRMSGWIALFLARFAPMGAALGLSVYPNIAAAGYPHTGGGVVLLIAPVVCLFVTMLGELMFGKGDSSGGCLPLVFVAIVAGIGTSIVGIEFPPNSKAPIYLLFACMLGGLATTYILSIPLSVYCAVGPAFTTRRLLTAAGGSYGPLQATFHAVAFTMASPLLSLLLGLDQAGKAGKPKAEATAPPSPEATTQPTEETASQPIHSDTNFAFECPHCGQRISTSTADYGIEGCCPTCSNGFTVPSLPTPTDSQGDDTSHRTP